MVKMSFLERIIKIQMCNSLTSYKKYFHMYRYLVRVPWKAINWGIFQIIFCGDDCRCSCRCWRRWCWGRDRGGWSMRAGSWPRVDIVDTIDTIEPIDITDIIDIIYLAHGGGGAPRPGKPRWGLPRQRQVVGLLVVRGVNEISRKF